MKDKAGFTLIELLVGIVILLVIFGSIISVFGISLRGAKVGLNQQEAYEEARLAMDEIKTTLRYADKDSIVFGPDNKTMTYSGKYFDKHWDTDKGSNVAYKMSLDFSNGKQLFIKKTLINGNKTKDTIITFPKAEANSAFIKTSEEGASKNWLEWQRSCDLFPVKEIDFSVGKENSEANIIYEIILPVKYLDENKKAKIDVLETKVSASDSDDEDVTGKVYKLYTRITNIVEKWGGTSAGWEALSATEQAEIKSFYHYYYYTYKERGNSSKLFNADVNPNSIFEYLYDNDRIREYLAYTKFDSHIFPLVILDDGSETGLKVYIQPCGKNGSAANGVGIGTDSVFLFGRIDGGGSRGWYTNCIYNHETQTWYTGPAFTVQNYGWSEAWEAVQSKNWRPVKVK